MLDASQINKNIPVPLYFQLKELLLTEIKKGTYKIGETIPTENELSEMFHISRTTVRQAVGELEHEGWLNRVKSKGTFVARPKFQQSFTQALESFNDQIIQSGRVPNTVVLDFKVMIPAEDIAAQLGLKPKEKVIYIHRKRCADNEPILMVETYLPYERCSFVMEHDLETESLYAILAADEKTRICKIERLIEAVEATEYDISNLGIESGKAIQQFISTGYNTFGDIIEYSISRYRGDRNTFKTTIMQNQ